jgi:tetratricopeptide (TPR) repeat protein
MNGKLDEAEQLLAEMLAENPDDAAGNYELARLMIHKGLGNREIVTLLPEAWETINRAVEKDSESVVYQLFAGRVGFMFAYMGMKQGGSEVAEKMAACCEAFEAVLRLKPDHKATRLNLVELYGSLPEEWGGDSTKAVAHMSELAMRDEVYGMKARSVLEEVSVADWKALLDKHPGNTEVLEELGKAHLGVDDVSAAAQCFEAAVKIDPSEIILFLDLGRYHVYSALHAMRSENEELQMTHLAAAEPAIRRYLEVENRTPMKAYALGTLAKVKRGMDEKDEMERLGEEAEALDPYYSKASGCPGPELFTPPGELHEGHRYMLRPL